MDYTIAMSDACRKYDDASKARAISEANYKDLDSQTKTRLAEAFMKAFGASTAKEREMTALRDPEYIAWLSVVSDARKKYLVDRSSIDIQEKRWETARSCLSMERAKTKIL